MEIIKIAMIVLVTVIIVNSIPTFNREITILITFSGCIVVLLYIVNIVVPAVEYVKDTVTKMSFDGMDIVTKAVGIGFITQFVSDISLDFGNKTLSNQMIFAGRVCILILTMPFFYKLFEIIHRLIN